MGNMRSVRFTHVAMVILAGRRSMDQSHRRLPGLPRAGPDRKEMSSLTSLAKDFMASQARGIEPPGRREHRRGVVVSRGLGEQHR